MNHVKKDVWKPWIPSTVLVYDIVLHISLSHVSRKETTITLNPLTETYQVYDKGLGAVPLKTTLMLLLLTCFKLWDVVIALGDVVLLSLS